jgi:hypothetical protein
MPKIATVCQSDDRHYIKAIALFQTTKLIMKISLDVNKISAISDISIEYYDNES